jgi:hypothetical protein
VAMALAYLLCRRSAGAPRTPSSGSPDEPGCADFFYFTSLMGFANVASSTGTLLFTSAI